MNSTAAHTNSFLSSNSVRNVCLAIACMTAPLMASAGAQGVGRQVLTGHLPSAMAGSRALRSMERTAKLNLSIGLPLRNEEQLDALLAQISDPSSPNYRHYLTPEQFAERFGPSDSDYQALTAFAQEKGLTVTKSNANRMVLNVTGTAPDVEKAFHVKMNTYSHPTRGQFYSADREPSIDADVKIGHVAGLNNFILPKPMNIQIKADAKADVSGSGPNGRLIGSDFRAAYAPNVSLNGAGQSVALLEFDGFFSGDVTKNFAAANLPAVPVTTVLVDEYDGSAGSYNTEVILDIMMAAYMAPALSSVTVYEGYWPDDILSQIACDNTAKQISSSWGFDTDSTTEQIFKQFQAQGQSFFQASGDDGGYYGGAFPPSDDPNITVVGGTNLTTAGAGGAWSAESSWYYSGGGVSVTYPIPSYQKNLNLTAANGSVTMRNVPDVSMVGAIQIYLVANNGQPMSIGGTSASTPLWAGFTALINQQAVANANPTVGFLNPAIYAIGNSGNYSQDFNDIRSGNNGEFQSVAGYDLATGWGSPAGQQLIDDLSDASQGTFTISPSQQSLTLLQSSSTSLSVSVTALKNFKAAVGFEAVGLPSGVTTTVANSATGDILTFTASNLVTPGVYSVKLFATSGPFTTSTAIQLTIPAPYFNLSASATSLTAIVGGASVASTISVQAQNNFNSSVAMAVSGLPVGVTATFSPASTKTTSVLTFKPSASAVPGVYSISVTGTSATTATAGITLTVPVPSFNLTASSPSLTALVGGGMVSDALHITNPVGLTGLVNLTLSGVPAGVTAGFSYINTIGSSTLSLTPSATVVPGTYTITVQGVSGFAVNSTTVTLVVPVPSFSLTASASSLTALVGGAKVSNTITVSNPTGLSGKVNLTLSGVPAGVTAALGAASTSTSSSLAFTPSATVIPGTYTVMVNGISATASSSAAITLVVPTPSFSLTASAPSLTALVGGAKVSDTITVGNLAGLSGKVNLTLSGVPAGVTAALGAASTTTTSSLAFTPSATVIPGTYTVMVNGISGIASNSAAITLVVPTPSFSLTPSASSLTALVGGSKVSNTIAVSNPTGLSGMVNLTLSGVPAGVTAALGVASTSTSTSLAFTPSATVIPGTYTVMVNGISGIASSSAAITLVVPTPSFSLSATTQSVTAASTSSRLVMALNIANPVGLSGKVSLTLSGLPTGVTAAFSAPSTSTSSTLTFTSGSSAVPGNYAVTVVGTALDAVSSALVSITVPNPGLALSAAVSYPAR